MLEQIIPFLNKILALDTSSNIVNSQAFPEKNEYSAGSFSLSDKRILFRQAKITQKKIGQFVAIWKRNLQGVTEPYSTNDNFDFMVIACQDGDSKGIFVFSKETLVKLGIISSETKEGKRGMRVYPSWDEPTNKQAISTQNKQRSYFYSI